MDQGHAPSVVDSVRWIEVPCEQQWAPGAVITDQDPPVGILGWSASVSHLIAQGLESHIDVTF
ncbi:hypothetical protein GCM10010412_065910 [Nonomuraea recticatena]|uniref:Uncharacterized protein n=1 Tax=Nonomuraea recticatena TaxID=46178 RepID=A0ABP6F1E9_9ACTN